MSKNTRNYAGKDDNKHDTIQKLKAQIKKLLKEIKLLRTENRTLQQAWDKTKDYLNELHSGKKLEDVLEYKKFPKEEDVLPEKKETDDKEEARLKWKNWNKERDKNE